MGLTQPGISISVKNPGPEDLAFQDEIKGGDRTAEENGLIILEVSTTGRPLFH